ncbi:hypothetical protein B0H17DRAFT_1214525 [Mycena rosella]|uniref:Uncharacterized protein n=1 Tax=Mycena rosella TaxID=1033263 RepID=A0AAD7CMV9_MYCRO|nr:hypothetical protein B0H17DRAFT_1214525 [Mycena rosella]
MSNAQALEIEDSFMNKRLKLYNYEYPDNPAAKGVAIVLNREITNTEGVKIHYLIPGKAMLAVIPWHGKRTMTVLAIYAPTESNEAKIEFWDAMCNLWLTVDLPVPDAAGGDLNLAPDALDRFPHHADPDTNNPDTKAYTHGKTAVGTTEKKKRGMEEERDALLNGPKPTVPPRPNPTPAPPPEPDPPIEETASDPRDGKSQAEIAELVVAIEEKINDLVDQFRERLIATRRIHQDDDRIPDDVHIAKEGEAVRILGSFIGNGVDAFGVWTPVLEKIDSDYARWANLNPTLIMRKNVNGMPPAVMKHILKAQNEFINDSKSSMISREMLMAPRSQGGIDLLDWKPGMKPFYC